jgi:hypothetical protein
VYDITIPSVNDFLCAEGVEKESVVFEFDNALEPSYKDMLRTTALIKIVEAFFQIVLCSDGEIGHDCVLNNKLAGDKLNEGTLFQ